MRLIDADALLQRAIPHGWSTPKWVSDIVIDDAPTIDAVPVVRCHECKYYEAENHNCLNEMGYARTWMPDDFCSFGERSEE